MFSTSCFIIPLLFWITFLQQSREMREGSREMWTWTWEILNHTKFPFSSQCKCDNREKNNKWWQNKKKTHKVAHKSLFTLMERLTSVQHLSPAPLPTTDCIQCVPRLGTKCTTYTKTSHFWYLTLVYYCIFTRKN